MRSPLGFAVIPFIDLVRMKLTSYRTKDRMHLIDLIDVGLLPGDLMPQLSPTLRERLQYLLDHPE